VPDAVRPSTKSGKVLKAIDSLSRDEPEAWLGSHTSELQEAHARLGLTKTSQLACKQEHKIFSKAVILSSHLLTGRVFNDVDSAGCSVLG